MQIWTRPGTAVGFEESAAGWTSRGSVEVTSEGVGTPTSLPLSFSLPQGSYFLERLTDEMEAAAYESGVTNTIDPLGGSSLASGPPSFEKKVA